MNSATIIPSMTESDTFTMNTFVELNAASHLIKVIESNELVCDARWYDGQWHDCDEVIENEDTIAFLDACIDLREKMRALGDARIFDVSVNAKVRFVSGKPAFANIDTNEVILALASKIDTTIALKAYPYSEKELEGLKSALYNMRTYLDYFQRALFAQKAREEVPSCQVTSV